MADAEHDATRRRVLLDAARACFLQFGYTKTSLDDIAKRANISRPLIYRKFKNKEALFGAVYDDTFDARYPQAEQVLAGRGPRKSPFESRGSQLLGAIAPMRPSTARP